MKTCQINTFCLSLEFWCLFWPYYIKLGTFPSSNDSQLFALLPAGILVLRQYLSWSPCILHLDASSAACHDSVWTLPSSSAFPKDSTHSSMVSAAQSLLPSAHWTTGTASKFSLLPQSLAPHNKAVLSLKYGSKDHLCQLALHCSPLWRGSTLITLTSEDISICRCACADLLTFPTWFPGLVHFWKEQKFWKH